MIEELVKKYPNNYELGEAIRKLFDKSLLPKECYSKKDMEKAFIAGGKMAKNIENPGFEEFIEQLNKEK